MTSNHIFRPIQDTAGNLLTDATVKFYQPGTTTPIADTLYSDAALTSPRTNGYAATTGYVDVYLPNPQVVRIGITRPSVAEVFIENILVGDIIPVVNPVVITTISIPGVLSVGLGNTLRHYIEDGSDLVYIRAAIGVAPVGASLVADIKNNGTSLFSGTPTNAPTWVASSLTPVLITSTTTDTDSFSAASYFTVDITQVGTGPAGSDLVVKIATRKNT